MIEAETSALIPDQCPHCGLDHMIVGDEPLTFDPGNFSPEQIEYLQSKGLVIKDEH
ncbi:MAG: hypothetical protein AB7V18_19390 [Pyrinomonadaceae bacterium]